MLFDGTVRYDGDETALLGMALIPVGTNAVVVRVAYTNPRIHVIVIRKKIDRIILLLLRIEGFSFSWLILVSTATY